MHSPLPLRRRWQRAALLLAFAAAAAPAPAAPPTPERVRDILAQRIDVGRQAPGIVVGIVGAAGRQVFSHGSVAVDDTRPLGADSLFPIASITKVFTALLLSDAVQHGGVALDDAAAKFLPADRVTVPTRGGRAITLIDLATHTSGLPERVRGWRPRDPAQPFAELTVEAGYQLLSGLTLTRDIGSVYEYSNFGYALLGHALERAEQQAFDALLTRRVLKPLGLNDTTLTPSETMQSRRVPGHDAEGRRVANWEFAAVAPAGALHSTANDLLGLLEAFLELRETPLREAMRAMLLPRRPGGLPPATATALGWMIVRSGERDIAWHSGLLPGHRTFIGFDATRQLGVVVLANANSAAGVTDLGLHLLDPAFPLMPQTAEVALDPARLDRYVGRYEFSPSFAYTITRDATRLYIQPTGYARSTLHARAENQFFMRSMHADVVFEAASGEPANALVFRNHTNGRDSRAVKR